MQIATCPILPWFSGPEFVIELIFALITFIIAFYANKIYKITKQRSIMLFGFGFFFVGLAYLIQAILNLLIFRNITTNDIIAIASGNAVVQSSIQLSILATISHIAFMILGLIFLAYVTLKERGVKILLLLLSISFVALVFSNDPLLVFYLLTSIYLLFITAQHYKRHSNTRSYNSLYVFLGFALLFLGKLQLALSAIFGLLYITGLIVLLIGYLLLLASLMSVIKK